MAASPEYTVHWERLPPQIPPEADLTRSDGPTAAAISGSLGAMATMPTAPVAGSTTFGSSILPPTDGLGWTEATRSTSLAYTAHWERLPPEISPEAAMPLRVGPTAAAISGSLGALVWRRPASTLAFPTTFGSSILPQTNGLGWAEAARLAATMASPESTARWERPLPETSLEAADGPRAGPTAAAISGSLGAMATMPAALLAISTTCGSSIPPRINGRGWAEAARCLCAATQVTAASPVCMARWVYLPPVTSPEADIWLRVGPTAAAISGSLGALATMPTAIVAFETIFGSSILPLARTANGPGWAEAARTTRLPECTVRRERLPPETSPEAELAQSVGPTAAAISGSLEEKATTPAELPDRSTTFGSSILPPTNGSGWAEAARLASLTASSECTARWERAPPETYPEADIAQSVGPITAAISGSLGAVATMPTTIRAISTTCGSISLLLHPRRRRLRSRPYPRRIPPFMESL